MKNLCSFIIFICILSNFYTNTFAEMIKREQVEPTGQVVWEVPTKKNLIALTFDDGPNPTYTPQILSILEQYQASATFFMIGDRMEQYPQVVQQVVEAGHELGNHSMTHPYQDEVGLKRKTTELTRADQILRKFQPNHRRLFRPPGGYIDDALLQEVVHRGYKVVLWSYHQDIKDWSMPGAKVIAKQVIQNARHGDIVLLHDGGGDRSQTVQALKKILPALKQKGYQFVSVSELLSHKK